MSSFLHVVKINYNLAKFGLNCLGLRGFHGAEDITPSTLTYLTGASELCAGYDDVLSSGAQTDDA
jgi:hypothetical protein